MAANPKFLTLLETLRDASNEGRHKWESADNIDEFYTSLDKALVTVGHSDTYGSSSYYTTLQGPTGKVIERLWEELGEDKPNPQYEFLREVHEAARRSVPRADDFLDNLIENVKAESQTKRRL